MRKMNRTWKVLYKRFKKDVQNVAKFPYDVNQTRQKLRPCVQTRRPAALKTKATSGTKRFQESKDCGH